MPWAGKVAQVEKIGFPGAVPSAAESATVALQIGRPVRGDIGISAHCRYGLPACVRTAPLLEDGTPFPTLFYLTCPVAVRDVGRLEATGVMEQMRDALAEDPELRAAYARAHERYLELRSRLGELPKDASAGGMPDRVKCLHALYAHELGDSNPLGAQVADQVEPIDCPGPCVADLGTGELERVPGHPGFRGGRRKSRSR